MDPVVSSFATFMIISASERLICNCRDVVILGVITGAADRLDAKSSTAIQHCDCSAVQRSGPVAKLGLFCRDDSLQSAGLTQFDIQIITDLGLPGDAVPMTAMRVAGHANSISKGRQRSSVKRGPHRSGCSGRNDGRRPCGRGRTRADTGNQHRCGERNKQGMQRKFQHSLLESGGRAPGFLAVGECRRAGRNLQAGAASPPARVVTAAAACRRGRRGSGIPGARRHGNGGRGIPARAASPACRRCALAAPSHAQARAP